MAAKQATTPVSPVAKNMQQVMAQLDAVLPALINLAETTFPAGSGDKKQAAVVGAASQFLASLGASAPPELVAAAMEEQIAAMEAAGTLGVASANPTSPAPAPAPVVAAGKPWSRTGAVFEGSTPRLI